MSEDQQGSRLGPDDRSRKCHRACETQDPPTPSAPLHLERENKGHRDLSKLYKEAVPGVVPGDRLRSLGKG